MENYFHLNMDRRAINQISALGLAHCGDAVFELLVRSYLCAAGKAANEACDNTRVTVNGKPAKASYDVKVGDHIAIAFGARTVTVEVLAVAEAVRKDDAAAMYREI